MVSEREQNRGGVRLCFHPVTGGDLHKQGPSGCYTTAGTKQAQGMTGGDQTASWCDKEGKIPDERE